MNTGYNFLQIRDPRLARFVPTDDEHIKKYPLRAAAQVYKPAPVICGINWYEDFYTPKQDAQGNWWIGKDPSNLGPLRGGHCVVIPHKLKGPQADLRSWYLYYNQLNEGACVGAGSSRAMSLLNRKKYKFFWLWNEAKKVDEWPETNPGDNEGTSVRAACDVLRSLGHIPARKKKDTPSVIEGIVQNRWAESIDDLLAATGNETYKKLGAMPIHNSWGEDYPHTVWVPCETLEKLRGEFGEFAVIMDYEKIAPQ